MILPRNKYTSYLTAIWRFLITLSTSVYFFVSISISISVSFFPSLLSPLPSFLPSYSFFLLSFIHKIILESLEGSQHFNSTGNLQLCKKILYLSRRLYSPEEKTYKQTAKGVKRGWPYGRHIQRCC